MPNYLLVVFYLMIGFAVASAVVKIYKPLLRENDLSDTIMFLILTVLWPLTLGYWLIKWPATLLHKYMLYLAK